MLVTLSMVFCLLNDPTQCQTVTPLLVQELSGLTECQIAGQIEGAKWVNEHPKYRLSRVRCTMGNRAPGKAV